MVDWMLAITKELVAELSMCLTVATLYSEQSPVFIKTQWDEGNITPLLPEILIDDASIEQIDHIVALAGAEQINEALATGADVVLAGRATESMQALRGTEQKLPNAVLCVQQTLPAVLLPLKWTIQDLRFGHWLKGLSVRRIPCRLICFMRTPTH
jgi:hypothetical protein